MNTYFELEQPRFGRQQSETQTPPAQVDLFRSARTTATETIAQIRAKIQDIQETRAYKAEINRKYQEIRQAETTQQPETTWTEKAEQAVAVVRHLPQIIAHQTERAIVHLSDAENRKQFAKKIADESLATVIGFSTKAAVVATGSAAIIAVSGASFSALPIAAVGVMAAGATREIYKNRDILFGSKITGREYFHRELGLRSWRKTETGTIAKLATKYSRGIKDHAIADTFTATEYQIKRYEIQQSLQQQTETPTTQQIIEQMKYVKLALDTSRTREERQAARETMQKLYKTLLVTAQTPDPKAFKTELKQTMVDINQELDQKAKTAAQKAVVATATQRVMQFATGATLFDLLHKTGITESIHEAWAEINKPAVAIAAERRMYTTYLPQVINEPPVHAAATAQPATLDITPIKPQTEHMVMTTQGPKWTPAHAEIPVQTQTIELVQTTQPAVHETEIEIKSGRYLFLSLKDHGFATDTKGSAQKFLDEVAPYFVKQGRMTEQQLQDMRNMLKGEDANRSAQWLQWKYGANKFNKIFEVRAGEKISIIDQTEQPVTVQKVVTTTETTVALPIVHHPELPAEDQIDTAPAIPVVPVAPVVEQPVEAQTPAEKTFAFNVIKPELASQSPITIATNHDEIFKLDPTQHKVANGSQISEWVQIPINNPPAVDGVSYLIDQQKHRIFMGWHSRYSHIGAQLGEGARAWAEGAGTKADPTRFTDIQMQAHLDQLSHDIQPTITFNQAGNEATYQLYETHIIHPDGLNDRQQSLESLQLEPDSLLIAYCGRAHTDAYKILALNSVMPAEIKQYLEIIQTGNGDVKHAVEVVTDWYKNTYSPQDTKTILENLRESGPAYLKPSINTLLNPNASGEEVNAATEEVGHWLQQKDPDAYRMFRLMYDGMDHIQDIKWMNTNFKEYYSWTNHILIFKAVSKKTITEFPNVSQN